jgi:D-xylose transport system permease protein
MKTLGISPRFFSMVVALAVIWITLNLLTDGTFLTSRNLYNLAVQTSVVGIMSTGMVLIIVARHIDLSVGSLLGFSGMVLAIFQVNILNSDSEYQWIFSVFACLAVGGIAGMFQGYWVAYRGVPAFIVTLAGLLMFRGSAFEVADGKTIAPMNETFQLLGGGVDGAIGSTWSWIFGLVAITILCATTYASRRRRQEFDFNVKPLWAELLMLAVYSGLIISFVMVMNSYMKPRSEIPRGIPVPVLILIGTTIVMTIVARATKFGRHVFAMGSNPEAAELAGINTKKVTMMIFMIMGVLAAIAAVITVARLNAGTNSMGTLQELNVIAAAVIGGTSLAGGIGTIPGAILGAVIMQSLDNGMVLLGVSSSMRQIVIGAVLILAVWFDVVYNSKNRR